MRQKREKWVIGCWGSSLVGGKSFRLPSRTFPSQEAAEAALAKWRARVDASDVAYLRGTTEAAASIKVISTDLLK